MVKMKKVEVIAVAYLNLKIPYSQAEALVSEWHEHYSRYDYQALAEWILNGDVNYIDGQLKLASYTTPEDLEQLVIQMRGADGVIIQDRLYNLKIYPNCFVGAEAVQWFMSNLGLTLNEAVRVGQRLLKRGVIHHVVDEQDFKNDYLFYRFYVDE